MQVGPIARTNVNMTPQLDLRIRKSNVTELTQQGWANARDVSQEGI
jgi:hypothetical protein